MSDVIDEWCEYHHNVNDISRDRRVAQRRVLRELEAMLPGPVQEIDGRDLERFIAAKAAAGYHPHTIVAQVRMIRPLVRWMRAQGMIDAERWLRLADVRGPRGAYSGQPRPYTRQEIRRFWTELDARYPWTLDRNRALRSAARGEHWVRRWAQGRAPYSRVYPYARRLQVEAVVALALYGGLRRGEIYRIAIPDMHYQNEYVRVLGARKGPDAYEKIRVVAMNKPLSLAIGNWIEFREQVLRPPHEIPWLCLWGTPIAAHAHDALAPMSYTQFQGLMRNVGQGWELHRLRHTFATERYRAGLSIEILQATLGHANIHQTQGYAQIGEDRIIEASRATDEKFIEALQRPDSTQEVT